MHRPWGHIDWCLNLSAPKQWDFIGCIGPEERSIAAFLRLSTASLVSTSTLLEIEDPESPYRDQARELLAERKRAIANCSPAATVLPLSLLSSVITVEESTKALTGKSIILDISSLPKRFFFFLLKKFFRSSNVENLVLIYTLAEGYPSAPIAENHDMWDALPTFRNPDPDLEEKAHRRLLVNVGFIPDGLIAHLENRADENQIDLIVPFPASVAAMNRTWQTVWALRSTPYRARFNEYRVGALDLSEAFDLILSLMPVDSNLVSFAPFGPKPISAAMCLYATLTGSPVYYAQPKIYRPDYSIGVCTKAGQQQITGYWIKHEGANLFTLPPHRSSLTS